MIEIRACAPEDAIAVGSLLRELGYNVSAARAAEHVRQFGNTGSDTVFLAVAVGQVIGLVAAHLCRMLQYENPVLRITALVVDGSARRRGVGKLLMQHVEHLAASAGCEIVELT